MYEDYTRQSLPSKEYRELLGSALCVFNSNHAFIVENILRDHKDSDYDWYKLIVCETGYLNSRIKETITNKSNESIEKLFSKIIQQRNRIIHSFQITLGEEQILATKEKNSDEQFVITEEYIMNFIKENEKLSTMLHEFRGF